ncbi:Homoserine/homoserine lactone efflux protein [Paenibacillus plantiphilus]|uniref:Homoserine/homoserine lactone efflux protein n=1 Tax=Paenibacillus plantiphilus TaxID=2905650 RepID=A0ABN8GH13_9BACL|nr:LysE family translocator [Paenibacillus plantiphilus]CAH1209084.1 Homoserine/homoserine lactone efflux protein [Paenibacillus plantiphilus]
MPGIEHYTLFVLSAIILNLTPGSDTLYIVGRTLSQGRSAGLFSVLGIVSGALLHTLFAAVGLSIILMQSAIAFTIVKWAGAAYLIYLGVRALFSKSDGIVMDDAERTRSMLGKIYWQGLVTNLLNPKVAIFYLAYLPQFIAHKQAYGALPFLILGITFIVTGTIWCVLLVMSAELMSRTIRKSKLSGQLNKVMGAIFIYLGLKLLSEGKP